MPTLLLILLLSIIASFIIMADALAGTSTKKHRKDYKLATYASKVKHK
jgi:hypothetical protein